MTSLLVPETRPVVLVVDDVAANRELLETVHPISIDGRVQASVGVYTSLRARDAAVAEAVRLIGVAVATGSVVLASVLALITELIVLRRLRRMERAAKAVAAGDFSVRLPEGEEPPARDEIVTVARQFDHMVRAVARQRAEIEQLAVTDGLTGLPNRRAFDERLGVEIGRAKRLGYSLTLSLVDPDGFKAINDSLGHLAGDEALRLTASALVRAVRQTDVVTRYGGDEFAVIHPGCDAAAAAAVGERSRAAVERLGMRPAVLGGRLLSASVGIAQCSSDVTAADLISAADQALYRAKARGGGVEVAAGVDGAARAQHHRP